jgi:hypothetical protein
MKQLIQKRLMLKFVTGISLCVAGMFFQLPVDTRQSKAPDRSIQTVAGNTAPVGGGPGNSPIRKGAQPNLS